MIITKLHILRWPRLAMVEKWSCLSQSPPFHISLCARGFQELQDFRTDSPTCSRESVRIAFAIIASNGWTINSIDVKTAFLQGKSIERTVFIHPPKEAKTNKIWQLRKCIYGLADAPRQWYLRVKEELIKLKSRPSDLDATLFC